MLNLLLIRHAENDYVRSGKLAGWLPDIHLNEEGVRQANLLGTRLASMKLDGLYSSPLERAIETAQAIATHHPKLKVQIDDRLGEARYGKWTGKRIKQLAGTKLWQIVQRYPSRARFPDGESLTEMQGRAVASIEVIVAKHSKGIVAVVSHGDVIKSILAHYLGMHLDQFQRIVIAPASLSAISFHHSAPSIVRMNDTAHYARDNHKKG